MVKERVWRELSLGFNAKSPRRMIEVMQQSGFLEQLFPEINSLFHSKDDLNFFNETMMAMDKAVSMNLSHEEIFAVLFYNVGKNLNSNKLNCKNNNTVNDICLRINPPKNYSELAIKSQL